MENLLGILDSYSTYSWPRMLISTLHAPTYHIYFELFLLCGIIWLVFQRSYRIKDNSSLSEKEKSNLIREWFPEPIVPREWKEPEQIIKQFDSFSTEMITRDIKLNEMNKKICNFSTMNFLDLTGNEDLNQAAIDAMQKYGIGSCGPRGFYGTFDAHLNFEADMAKFLNVQDVILYSYGFSAMASAIPSYSKRNDLIFADELVNQSIHQGLIASRSTIISFQHNNLNHLEKLLQLQQDIDKKDYKKAQSTRKFIVVEALYRDTGKICDLRKLVELKYKYKVRILLDESHSIGILGKTGRGSTEYHEVDIKDIDMIAGSLENAFANYGGFCAGSSFVIDHQRLSGSGYCFSASSPPILSVALCESLKILNREEGQRQARLLKLSNLFNEKLDCQYFSCVSHPDSPIKHIQHKRVFVNYIDEVKKDLQTIVDALKDDEESPFLVNVTQHSPSVTRANPAPSIRICLNCNHTESEVILLLKKLHDIGCNHG